MVADELTVAYPSLGLDLKKKIIEQTHLIIEKKYKLYPTLFEYMRTIVRAQSSGLSQDKFLDYLDMTRKVIDEKDQKNTLIYLRAMSNFFEYRALNHSVKNRLYAFSDDFEFEYVGPPELETTEYVDDYYSDTTSYDDFYYDTSSYDEFYYDDSYVDPYYSDTSTYADPYAPLPVEELDPLELARPVVELPEPNGPVIRFNSLDLNFATFHDSVFVEGTSGFFNILDKTFTGSSGKFDWTTAGLNGENVYVKLKDYTFDVTAPEFRAVDVMLTNTEKLKEPIEGILNFKSERHDSVRAAVYPRFLSYRGNHRVEGIAPEEVSYQGGFSMKGADINSNNLLKERSHVEIMVLPGKRIVAEADEWVFEDSLMYSPHAQIWIIHKRDTISHPSVKFQYYFNSKLLRISKEDGHFKDTPYLSTYFNMNILTEVIEWDMSTDSLNMRIDKGKKWVPTVFESVDHFEKADFLDLNTHYTFHPLVAIVNYYKRTGYTKFYLTDVSAEFKLNQRVLRGATLMLQQKGLLDYDDRNGEINLHPQAILLFDANYGKSDYDDIIFESVMSDQPENPNATFYLEDERIVVRGVEFFQMSDSLNVQVTPDSSLVTLLKDRTIQFDGKISAGNFEYTGKDFTFKYDSFLVNMGVIEEVKFYVTDSLGNRTALDNSMVGLDSAAAAIAGVDAGEDTSAGTLYINDPTNKSALIKYPNYPNFNTGMGAVVYFDRPEIFNGIYDKSIFFVAPPFDIDSLGDSDPSAIEFDGKFVSSGMFPIFEEKLKTQPDNSMGFYHSVPEEGYQLFEGSGKLTGDIKLDKKGIRSSGQIDFLSTTLRSTDFIFYPDSVTGYGVEAEIREEEHKGVIFPQAQLTNYRMRWLPRKDSLYMYNTADPFQFYDGTASLDGAAIISNRGVYGTGTLITRGSTAKSNRLTFNHNSYAARHAQFDVQSNDPLKPALSGNDVRLSFSLDENYADISPEVEGQAAVEFPYAQFRTSIPDARWDLNAQKIYMTKPENVPIEKSYFYTTRPDLDSLRFNATSAVYDIETLELKVSGIPYIIVADAKITPENNEVLILENSKIGTLQNTVIVMDTVHNYHRLYDGVINVISRNEFSGYATYELINAVGDTFAIKMTDFRLEDFTVGEGRRTVVEKHTVANGEISDEDNILFSPGFYFKGDVKLEAHRPVLEMDGFLKLNLQAQKGDDEIWIHYNHNADQEEINLDFDKSVSEDGRILHAGLYFSNEDFHLYPLFVGNIQTALDKQFFRPSGMLYYNEDEKHYVIEDTLKSNGTNFSGKSYIYNENTQAITFEGPVNFFEPTKEVSVDAAVLGNGFVYDDSVYIDINTFMAIDFKIPNQIWDIMAYDLEQVIENLGAPEGLGDPTELLYKVAEIMGERATKDYEAQTLQEYISLGGFTRETSKPLVFADVNLTWSAEYKSFYSNGLLGMSNMLNYDVNAAWEGFMEFARTEDGLPMINIFLKASSDSWYYISWQDNRLMLYSSNEEFNQAVAKRTNAEKAKIGELVFIPGGRAEAQEYVDRFRSQYYGITTPYELDSNAQLEEKEKKDKETKSDDGF